MSLYNYPNSSTLDGTVIQIQAAVPSFTPLLLLFTFMVVFIGGSIRQKDKTGTADYATWSVVASISTLLVTLIMSVTQGLIRLDWLVVVIVITIFSGVWMFLDRRQSEV